MKVLHLCYYYGNNTSGAPVAAMRLHQALLRSGVESHYICVEQREPGENVHVLPHPLLLNRFFYLVVRVFWVLSKILTGRMLMPNLFPLAGLEKVVSAIDPDVVHIQYVGQDMVSFSQLERLHRPMVFTLHDLSLANAVEPHPKNDLRFFNGFRRDNSRWFERWMYRRKMAFVSRTKMVFTGPSRWVCEMFARSLIGRGHDAKMVLNIVDPLYAYNASAQVPHEKFTLLFGAYGGRQSQYKGWDDLVGALTCLPQDVRGDFRLLVFGEDSPDQVVAGVEVHFLGALRDAKEIRAAHHTADVFVLPSRQDNAPQVKFEALLDGLPVVAFQRTGCAEFIGHCENGWIAPDGDLESYAAGLLHFYRLFKSGTLEEIRQKIADRAQAEFSEDGIVNAMMEVYACAVGRR